MEGLCTKLDKVQNIALRAVLPVWKTIPISILQKEAGTPLCILRDIWAFPSWGRLFLT